VFCLVDIYSVLGETFTPYLAKLSTSQLKLVTIYNNRMKSQQKGQTEDQSVPAPSGSPERGDDKIEANIVPGTLGRTPVKKAR